MAINNEEIYDRQTRIPGWDQEKISNARVLVAGSSILAQQTLVNLVGLGIKNLMLLSEERIKEEDNDNFLYSKLKPSVLNDYKIDHIANTLQVINTNLEGHITLRHGRFTKVWLMDFEPDIIIEATNNSVSKRELLAYAIDKNIRFISGTSNEDVGLIVPYTPLKSKKAGKFDNNKKLEDIIYSCFDGERQGILTSGVIAGLIADQVRKYRLQLGNSDLPLKTGEVIYYNICSSSRNSYESDIKRIPFKIFRKFNVLVIGAGAIGNTLVSELSLMGFGNIDIIDGDIIEYSNLSSQYNFRGKVGKNKAEVLAERAMEHNNVTKAHAFSQYLTENEEYLFERGNRNGRYHIVFGAVDKLEVRKLINDFARKYKLTYIDGGTSYTGGQVKLYAPGHNRCLDCQINYDKTIKDRKKKLEKLNGEYIREGCQRAAPSVIIPNFIIGSSMVAEAMRVIYSTSQKDLLNGTFSYNTFKEGRISVNSLYYKNDCGICGGK
jgi:molybdopterin/thiamine biosynthesis adenylyltransferase